MIENVIMLNRKIYPCSGNCSRGKFLKKDSSLLFIFFIFAYFKKAEKWLEWICFRNASGNYTFEGVVLVAVLQVCSKN